MTTNGSEVLDVAEQLRGRVKFYHVGDPHRNLLVKAVAAIENLWNSQPTEVPVSPETVQEWLQDQGVKLTKAQLTKLGLDG